MSDFIHPPVGRAIRGRLLSFSSNPRFNDASTFRYIEDGVVLVENGVIAAVGEAPKLLAALPPGMPLDHYPQQLILPGFIDAHVHYPQTKVIASYGAQLLEWLHKYAFVEEQNFCNPEHAATIARFFFDELLRNGTTTAAVYCTVHSHSVDAFFVESERRGTRMIAGKVMMDRNAPVSLRDTAECSYAESKALLETWRGRGRQHYAITPRFAVTSSEAQLEAAGALAKDYPQAYVQTHLSENHAEIALVKSLFPWAKTYTQVYERFGLLGPRSLLGHCIHLDESEIEILSSTRSVAAFCPTSNLFLGSGLFDMKRLRDRDRPVRVGIATDIGGGTSYSMLRTASEAYKVLQLQGQPWSALEAFYMMTRGNAEALGLSEHIGSLEVGKDADIIVLDSRATPAMAHRMESVDGDLAEELFLLMTLGDDRAVTKTYVGGC